MEGKRAKNLEDTISEVENLEEKNLTIKLQMLDLIQYKKESDHIKEFTSYIEKRVAEKKEECRKFYTKESSPVELVAQLATKIFKKEANPIASMDTDTQKLMILGKLTAVEISFAGLSKEAQRQSDRFSQGITEREIYLYKEQIQEFSQQIQENSDLYTEFHRKYVEGLSKALSDLDLQAFAHSVDLIAQTSGVGQVFIAGNGGSAATAEHFAHNINWDASTNLSRDKKLSARSLNSEGAEVTARGNDRNQAFVFATQLDNHVRKNDIFIGISGSGNSDNILKAFKRARDIGIPTIFIGKPQSKATDLANLSVTINSEDQQLIEDATHVVMHMTIRALRVKLEGLDKKHLLSSIANLQNKFSAIQDLSKDLGVPSEIEAFVKYNSSGAM